MNELTYTLEYTPVKNIAKRKSNPLPKEYMPETKSFKEPMSLYEADELLLTTEDGKYYVFPMWHYFDEDDNPRFVRCLFIPYSSTDEEEKACLGMADKLMPVHDESYEINTSIWVFRPEHALLKISYGIKGHYQEIEVDLSNKCIIDTELITEDEVDDEYEQEVMEEAWELAEHIVRKIKDFDFNA